MNKYIAPNKRKFAYSEFILSSIFLLWLLSYYLFLYQEVTLKPYWNKAWELVEMVEKDP